MRPVRPIAGMLLISCLLYGAAWPAMAGTMSSAAPAAQTPASHIGKTPASHIGSIMAVLATFHEAGVLPPESSAEANQLIHALIQSQSIFLKSAHPVVREFFTSALSERFDERKAAALTKAFASTGWTSETLEALVDYSAQRPITGKPDLADVFRDYHVAMTDWALVARVFETARDRLLGQGKQIHAVFAAQRATMPSTPTSMPDEH